MERNAKNCRKKSILCKFGVGGLFVWEQQQQQGGGGQAYSKIRIYHLDKLPLLLPPFFLHIYWMKTCAVSVHFSIDWMKITNCVTSQLFSLLLCNFHMLLNKFVNVKMLSDLKTFFCKKGTAARHNMQLMI